MTYIDTALLNLVESAYRRFQLLTGKTNVWLAVQLTNLSIVVYFVWAGVVFLSTKLAFQIFIGLFCGVLFYVLPQTVFKVPIETYENHAYVRAAKGLRNPRRLRDAPLRISFLTLSFLMIYPVRFVYLNPGEFVAATGLNFRLHIVVLTYALIVLTTVVLYLLACDPLPPCAGKVREWLRGSAPARQAASEKSVA